jgi:pimeloyl-ACP methyl ester carboxylesterase
MIRFYLILILFLTSLLCVFKAPEYHLWLLAIVVTEFPLLFISITALLTASGFWMQRYQLAGTILGLVTLGIFLSPIFRAYWVSKGIKQDMIHSLGGIYTDSSPVISYGFSIGDLFKRTKDIPYQTLTYVKYADTSMSLDLYPSQVAGNKPCIIVVHGGSWAGGDSRQLPELNGYLAAKGYNVASINYRLAPKYQTPTPVKDVEAAMAYLKKHADELHIDTNNFILLGRSAGAQIALLAAYTMHDPALKGVIDFYGPADMVWGYSVPSSPWIMDSRKVMENYIGGRIARCRRNMPPALRWSLLINSLFQRLLFMAIMTCWYRRSTVVALT